MKFSTMVLLAALSAACAVGCDRTNNNGTGGEGTTPAEGERTTAPHITGGAASGLGTSAKSPTTAKSSQGTSSETTATVQPAGTAGATPTMTGASGTTSGISSSTGGSGIASGPIGD